MVTIQIHDIPEEDLELLRNQARAAGKPLETYLQERLRELAQRPSPDEIRRAISAYHRAYPPRQPFDPDAVIEAIAGERG